MALKLRDRILGWSIASTLIIVASVLILVDSFFSKTIRANTEESLVSGARLAGELHRSRVEGWITDVARTALEPTLRASLETGDPRTIGELLDTARANVGADWLAVATPEGDILAQAGPVPIERVGSARQLIEDTKYYDYGDLWVEGDTLVEVGASSVNFGALRLGVLFGGRRIDQTRADEMAANTGDRVAFLAGGHVTAADSAVHDADGDVAAVDWSDGPPGNALRAGDPMSLGTVRDFRVGGEEYLGTALSLHGADGSRVGSLVVFRSLDAAFEPVRGLRYALAGIGGAGIILGLVMSLALSRSVTSPVDRLLEDTVRLGSGNLEEPIAAISDDEIGQLAIGVDRMRVSLREAREEVIRRERLSAVGTAASAIVHDFAQPVTVISAHTEFLALGGDDVEERKREINSIRDGVRRIQTMMREVLEFAKGEVKVEKTTTNIASLLHEVATQAKSVAQSSGVNLQVVPDYSGDWVLDYHRTSRALGNLVRNAAAAMSTTGGGTIKLRSLRENGSLRLEVEDDGPGIPDEIRHSLFEPFVTRGKREGTGLGLAIVKNIAESQGGRVAIETSAGRTVFMVELPEAAHSEVEP